MQYLQGGQEQPDNITDYKRRTKWCNNYAETGQLINFFTSKKTKNKNKQKKERKKDR